MTRPTTTARELLWRAIAVVKDNGGADACVCVWLPPLYSEHCLATLPN